MINSNEINKISNILINDGIIAFPTDTVWGVGCLPDKENAVKKIYSVKGRSSDKPLILMSDSVDKLMPYVQELPEIAKKIIAKYFPGAVTLVLPKSSITPDFITSGFNTVGIRVPNCEIFAELVNKCTPNGVLATTSANLSGSGATAVRSDVVNSLGEEADYIVESYDYKPLGKESTVALVTLDNNIKILRQGAVILDI